MSIVYDREQKFTSRFWGSFQEALDTMFKFNTSFHSQTDGQSERDIQILEDMLRACSKEFEGSLDKDLALMDFAYNKCYQ